MCTCSRAPLRPEDEEAQHGMRNVTIDKIADELAETDVLVCLLPLTDATRNIVNAPMLAHLKRGAVFINAARGEHVVEEDLLEALDSGVSPLPPLHACPTAILVTRICTMGPEQGSRRAITATSFGSGHLALRMLAACGHATSPAEGTPARYTSGPVCRLQSRTAPGCTGAFHERLHAVREHSTYRQCGCGMWGAGALSCAVLDVTRKEPLPVESPLWGHSKVRLTAHTSSNTNRPSAITLIAENYRRHLVGKPMEPVVNTLAGY